MSKVKIQGNASGTGVVTLTAPNTKTERTITLPDGDISLGVGIDDNATSTAITIDASENVGIGVTAPDATLETSNNTTTYSAHFGSTLNATGDNVLAITAYDENPANTSYLIRCTTNTGVAGAGNNRFSVLADGRGLSQFTAKAWCKWNGTGTIAINASHNVSSIVDQGTGVTEVLFDVDHSTGSHCTLASTAPDFNAGCTNFGAGTVTVITEYVTNVNVDVSQNMMTSFHL